ncbi:hypothetical protein BGX23_001458 [Mortierella sp. AD031]|nr:hypothetical protein BGX23_001458 [Mortierella sp. AD031]
MPENTPLVQAIPSVNKSSRTIPATADPADVFYVDVHTDPATQNRFVLWEDIQLAFENALHSFSPVIGRFTKGNTTGNTAEVTTGGKEEEAGQDERGQDCALGHIHLGAYHQEEPGTSNDSAESQQSNNKGVLCAPHEHPLVAANEVAQSTISASLSDKNAQIALGDMYRDGREVHQNYQAAMIWYLRATVQGDPVAQRRVGALYNQGLGVPQDYTTAMNRYLSAAGQGHAPAQCNIGALYYRGHGVPRDYSKAMDWYLKAA